MQKTTLIITYPNGTQQIVRPNPQYFNGNWSGLADAIAAQYFPPDHHGNRKVVYETR